MSGHGYSRATLVAALLIVLASARIAATFRVFSQVIDEPAHIGAGMEWLDRGTYTLELQQPPLARIFAAIGPYLAGIRYHAAGHMVDEGNRILGENDRYSHNLALARYGVLPFFVLCSIAVFFWGRRISGDATGVAALLLFSTVPLVLGYGGLAITDMAAAAMLTLAIFAWREWLDDPRLRNAAWLGVASGLALLAKFSAVLFIPAGFAAIALLRFRQTSDVPLARRVLSIAFAITCAFVMTWAGYRFSFGTIRGAGRLPTETINATVGHRGVLHDVGWRLIDRVPVPAPEIPLGILHVREHDRAGHDAFLLGRHSKTGWWYYFPFAIAVKSPIPFLLLFGWGAIVAVRRRSRALLEVLLAAMFLLGVAMTSGINIGVRHVLPVYPLLALIAGAGCVTLWRSGMAGRITVSLLVAWQLASSVVAHPDYFPYFNELAGRHPERVLEDSNFDWGQDLLRLQRSLRRHHAESVWLDCFGSANLADLHFPPWKTLDASQPVDGWVAVSQMKLQGTGDAARLGWLLQHEPVERVGKTILLFHVPAPPPNRQVSLVLLPLSPVRPIKRQDRAWMTTLTARNHGDLPLYIDTPQAPSERIFCPPLTTLPDALARSTVDGTRGRLLLVDADVELHLYLRDVTRGRSVELPIARASDLRSGAAAFPAIRLAPGSAGVIRLFSLVPASIEVRWNGRNRIVETTLDRKTSLPSAEVELAGSAVEQIVDVDLHPVEPSLRYWAFAMTTSETTGETHVIELKK